MEYREEDDPDVDDLLGMDDDEEEYTESVEMLGVDALLAEQEDLGPSTSKQMSEAEKMMFLAEDLQLADSDEEAEEDAVAVLKKKKEKEEARAKKLRQKFRVLPPGINLFPGEVNGFKYFTLETLNLETDFNYTRRGKLKGHGFSDEKIDLIFSDRVEFVRHLMPEAQSVLICDKNDFRPVMNFLFYSLAVCTERNVYDLMAKAFFDLRKNYGFKWMLQPKHIMCCLLNYGADEKAVYNETFFRKAFADHLRTVRQSGQKLKNNDYTLPDLPFFLDQRRKGRILFDFKSVPEKKFNFVVEKFIKIVCDFSAGLPMYLEFRYKNNWSDQVLLLYLLLLLGTDKRFIQSYKVKDAIKNGIHYHLDSFSTEQWFWGPLPPGASGNTTKNGRPEYIENNAAQSMVTMFESFYPGDICPIVRNWDIIADKAEMTTTCEGKTDHHLNMMYRLSLFPPSSRGNAVKKLLAFMYLQALVQSNEFIILPSVDAIELADTADLCDCKTTFFQIIASKERANYGLLTSIVELYDIIVGHEPMLDFTELSKPSILKLKNTVLRWLIKRLPRSGSVNINDSKSIKSIMFNEYVDMVDMRWETWLKNV